MKDHDRLKELYGNLINDNYKLGTYDSFEKDMQDEKKMKELYGNLINDDYGLPDFKTFRNDMGYGDGDQRAEQSGRGDQSLLARARDIVSTASTSTPTTSSTPGNGTWLQRSGLDPLTAPGSPMARKNAEIQARREESKRISEMSMEQLGRESQMSLVRAQAQAKQVGKQVGNMKKAASTLGGHSEPRYNPETARWENVYYTANGEVLGELEHFSRTQKENAQRKAETDFDAMLGSVVSKTDPDNAAAQAWANAEKRTAEAQTEHARRDMNPYASSLGTGFGQAAQLVLDMKADHLKYHDLQKMADEAWELMGKKRQNEIMVEIYKNLVTMYPNADDREMQRYARLLAKQQSDRRLFELAVEKNAPKDATDYFFRNMLQSNMLNMLADASARTQTGTTGDWAARDQAEEQFRSQSGGNKAAGIAGTVLGFVVDPTTWISSGAGSLAAKGAAKSSGKWAMKKALQTSFNRAIAGGANFATFEALGETLNQFKYGGEITGTDAMGNYIVGDYNGWDILAKFGKGLGMGSLTAEMGGLIGDAGNRAVAATKKAIGGKALRTAATAAERVTQFGTGLTAEATLFAAPEMIATAVEYNRAIDELSNPESDTYISDPLKRAQAIEQARQQRRTAVGRVWGDNMAMIAGFKAQGLVKSGPAHMYAKYQAAHHLKISDQNGASLFGADQWREAKQTVEDILHSISRDSDGTPRLTKDGKKAMRDLMDGRGKEQQQAIADYFGARVKSEVLQAVSGINVSTDAEKELQAEYGRGFETMMKLYSRDIDPNDTEAQAQILQQASDIAIERDQAREQLVESIGEPAVSELEQSRLGGSDIDDALTRMVTDGKIAESDREAIQNYMKLHAAYSGVEHFVNQAGDGVAAVVRQQMQPMRDEKGGIREITLKDGRKVYHYNGELSINEDGTIDSDRSDQTIAVFNPEKGEHGDMEIIEPDDISTVGDYKENTTIESEIEQSGNAYKENLLKRINGVFDLQPGDKVQYLTKNGQTVEAEVTEETSTGWVVEFPDGSRAPINRQEAQSNFNGERIADYRQRHGLDMEDTKSEEDTAAEHTEDTEGDSDTVTEAELFPDTPKSDTDNTNDTDKATYNGEPQSYEPMTGITVRDDDGSERHAVVIGRSRREGNGEHVPDENGRFIDYVIDGENEPRHTHETEMGKIVVSHDTTEEDTPTLTDSDTVTEAELFPDNQPTEDSEAVSSQRSAGTNISETGGENAEKIVLEMPMRKVKSTKVDKKTGKKKTVWEEEEDWMATTAETAYDYLYVEAAKLGLTKETADNIVAANLKKAEKKMEEAKKATGSVMSVLRKQKAAQDEVDYWKKVKRLRSHAMLAEAEAEAERTKEQRAAEAARRAEIRERRRNTETAAAGRTPGEKYDAAEKIVGNSVSRTIADKTKIKGRYVLVEADALTPSHDPMNGWRVSEGFPTTEDGRSVNDRVYENDKGAQDFTESIAREYDGQAVTEIPVVSSEGIVYDGNGRTMAGQIAARDNTDAAYIEALTENAANFGFTEEQVRSMDHPRVVMQVDEDMPYNATTFARFNKESKKKMDNTNKAVSVAKQMTDAARDAMLEIIDRHGTLETFFASEKAADDVVNMLIDGGFITRQESPAFREKNSKGEMVLSSDGRNFVTNMMLGTLFDEEAIRKLGDDKALKNSLLRAVPQIAENRRLGDYALTEDINTTIDLLYEARKSGMTFDVFKRQGNLIEGMVEDRYEPMVVLLADEMSSGVDNFREVLTLYNKSASDEVAGGSSLFEPRTREDIKKDIVEYYKKKRNGQSDDTGAVGGQPGAAADETRLEGAEAGDAVPGAQEGDGRPANGQQRPADGGQRPVEPQTETVAETPVIRAYNKLKSRYPDRTLLQRVGDYYHVYGEDARRVSEVLGTPLVQESGTDKTGVPYNTVDASLTKLIRAGMKVALADGAKLQKIGDEAMSAPTAEQRAIVKGLAETLRGAGIPVVADVEKGQAKLDRYRALVRLMNGGKRTTPEIAVPGDESPFKATVISGVDGAKIAKKLDNEIERSKNLSLAEKRSFLGDLAKVLGARRYGSRSEYATFETRNGEVTLRLSDHNATVSNFDHSGRENGISIVISRKPDKGVTDDGEAHIVEYFYKDKDLKKSDGTPYADIVSSVQQMLYSGEYRDRTGLAQVHEVNSGMVLREMKVFHGSGADFEAFDSSHMGEGEGAQAYGWGHYTTEVEGIGRVYAKQGRGKYTYHGKNWEALWQHGERNGEVMAALDVMQKLEDFEYYKTFDEIVAEIRKDAEEAIESFHDYKTSVDHYRDKIAALDRMKPEDFTRKENILYTVEIPDDNGGNYLEWDRKIDRTQGERIADAMSERMWQTMSEEDRNSWDSKDKFKGSIRQDVVERTGNYAYERIASNLDSDKAASEFLHDMGYVGIKYPADYRRGGRSDGAKNYVIFNDGDLRITEKIRFHKADNGEYEPEMKPVFYSNAEKAVEGIKQEKATAEQWLAMIQKSGGLKAGEDKWMGLGEWLGERKGKSLTKQEVLDFIRANRIEIEEVEYEEYEQESEFNDYKREYKEYYDEAEANGESDPQNAAWERMIDEHGDDFALGFYAIDDQLHTDNDSEYLNYEREQMGAPKGIHSTRLQYTTEGLENKREIALTVPDIESWNEGDEVHFGDAGEGRAVAWVRFGETTDKDGKRVLVIDEIQSKRHQEGRKKTYIPNEYRDFVRQMRDKYHWLSNDNGWTRFATRDEVNTLESFENKHGRLEELVPDAPFEKNWHELCMKRMLRYAAENGYDKVAWTKGEQQAERYSLGTKLDGIEIDTVWDDGSRSIKVIGKDDGYRYDVNVDANGVVKADNRQGLTSIDGKTVQEVLGKELGTKIMESAEGDYLDGNDLRIGGEGMEGFYDQILPRFADKYGKKWGVKTTDIELPSIGDDGLTMHSVEVTDEMKASVMEGQPMFFRGEDGEVLGYTLDGEIYIDPRYAKPDTPVHEYTHLWADALERSNPKAFARLADTMRQERELWEYVRGRYPEIANERELVKEVFAHYSGKRGRERLESEMREEMAKADDLTLKAKVATMFHKLRSILTEFWNMSRQLFAGKVEGIERMSAEDFADMTLADLLKGFDPRGGGRQPRSAVETRDREYMEAVEKGDKEAQQKMVAEAAREAGYNTKGYHQTANDFTVFNPRHRGSGTSDPVMPFGIFIKPTDKNIGIPGDKQMALYARIDNPIRFADRTEMSDWLDNNVEGYKEAREEYERIDKEYQSRFDELDAEDTNKYDELWNQWKAGEISEEEYQRKIDEIDSTQLLLDEWKDAINKQAAVMKELVDAYMRGSEYDGVIIDKDNGSFGRQTTTILALDPNQVKSAEPVTYDDAGNVIPLSERFDSGKADIRFQKEGDPQPIGQSMFGNVYDQFKGKVKEAFDFLIRHKEGDLLGVFHRDDAGDIDLVWGDKGGGLDHIIDKHVGEGKSFATVEEAMNAINDIINNGKNDFEDREKIVYRIGDKIVTLRKNYREKGKKIADKNWVLTAYDELSADSGSPAATIESKAGIATSNSAAKVQQNSDTGKNNLQEGENELSYNGTKTVKRYREAHPEPTIDDYHMSTNGNFEYVGPVQDGKTWRERDAESHDMWDKMKESGKYEYHKSDSGSEYLIDRENGDIYRYSDHWGRVASCKWYIDVPYESRFGTGYKSHAVIGKINVKDLEASNNDYYLVFNDGQGNEIIESNSRGDMSHLLYNQDAEGEGGTTAREGYQTYTTRAGVQLSMRSLLDDIEGRDGASDPTESGTAATAPAKQPVEPTGIRLRKLKPGETCNVERRYEESRQFSFTGKERIESMDDVAYIFKQLETAAVENAFVVLVKDGRPTVLHVGMGGYAQTSVDIRQAMAAYVETQPDAVYFVHNHPSGNLKASREDMGTLATMREVFGKEKVKDGIIIDTVSGKYGVYGDIGREEKAMPQGAEDEVPMKVYTFSKQVFSPDWNPQEAFEMSDSEKVAEFVSSHRLGRHKKMSLIVLNTQGQVVGNFFLPWTKMSDIEDVQGAAMEMSNYVNRAGGVSAVLYGNYEYDSANDRPIMQRIASRMGSMRTKLLDVVQTSGYGDYHSAAEYGAMEPGVEKLDEAHGRIRERGLRELAGEDGYGRVLDGVYKAIGTEQKAAVDGRTGREFLDAVLGGNVRRYEDVRRKAVEAELARLTDKPYEEFTEEDVRMWQAAKREAERALDVPKGFEMSDNELKYLLWRSKEGLEKGKENFLDIAKDVAKRYELGLLGQTEARDESGEEESIYRVLRNGSMDYKERIAAVRVGIAAKQDATAEQKRVAVEAIGASLADLNKAMSLQREYDRTTVKRVSDLARVLISGGYLDNMSKGEVKRLISALSNATGKQDTSKEVETVMDVMIDNQLRRAEKTLSKMEKITGNRVDAKGVVVGGKLDPAGQQYVKAFRSAKELTDEALEKKIVEMENDMADPNMSIAEEAAWKASAYRRALEYVRNIKQSRMDEIQLKDDLHKEELKVYDVKEVPVTDENGNVQFDIIGLPKTKKVKHVKAEFAGEKNNPIRKQAELAIKAMDEAIRQNKIERIQAYTDLMTRLGGSLKDSAAKAKAFKDADVKRVRAIHHYANSDMEGRELKGHQKDTAIDNVANNPIVRAVLSPLMNLDQMLRMFGRKNPDGKGYLWEKFMYDWQKSVDGEQVWQERYMKKLNDKVAEIFGKTKAGAKYKYWMLEHYAKAKDGMTVKYWDGAAQRDYTLPQSRMMYLYAVDKMPLGKATNRRMGITDETMAEIVKHLDPKLKEFVDWVQEELLPGMGRECNEVHKRMFGADMDSIENYFPFVRDKNALKTQEENGGQKQSDKISTVTGAIKKRTTSTAIWDMPRCNFMDVLTGHIQEMSHWANFAELNRDFATLLSYNHFKEQVMKMQSVYGASENLWDNFKKVTAIATDAYDPKTSDYDKYVSQGAKGVTMGKVAARPFTAVKQFLSQPAFWGDANPVYVLEDLASLGLIPWYESHTEGKKVENAFMWAWRNMPNFRKRIKSRTSGDYYLRDTEYDEKTWMSKIMDKTKWGMLPNIGVDAWTIALGSHAVYRTYKEKYLRQGMSEEQAEKRAILDAELCFNKSQQSSEGAFMAPMQIDHTMAASTAMVFRNSSTSYTREWVAANRNLKRLIGGEIKVEDVAKQILRGQGKETWTEEEWVKAKKDAKKEISTAVVRNTTNNLVFGWVLPWAWRLGGLLPLFILSGDDDEKWKRFKEAGRQSMFGPVEGLLYGDVQSDVLNKIVGNDDKEWKYIGRSNPIVSDAQNIKDKIGYDPIGAITDASGILIGMVTGINPQTVVDWASAIVDKCKGDRALTREGALFVARLLNCPPSQLKHIYFEELDMYGEEASNYTPEELIDRWARYKVKNGHMMISTEALVEKQKKQTKKIVKDKMKSRVENMGDKEVNEAYEEYRELMKPMEQLVKEAKAATKRDWIEGANRWGAIYKKKGDYYNQYIGFKELDKKLDKLAKWYLEAESADEAHELGQALCDFKAAMVESQKPNDAKASSQARDRANEIYLEQEDRQREKEK